MAMQHKTAVKLAQQAINKEMAPITQKANAWLAGEKLDSNRKAYEQYMKLATASKKLDELLAAYQDSKSQASFI